MQSLDDTRECVVPIKNVPTSGQPILDTTLKDMLVFLRGTLHSDMISFIALIKSIFSDIGERVNYVENKMWEFATAHNELMDAHKDTEAHTDRPTRQVTQE